MYSTEYRNKDWLYQKIMVENLSHQEVAELCDVAKATIADYCMKYRVIKKDYPKTNRDYGANTANLKNKDWLIERYVTKGMSLGAIAKQESVGKTTVAKALAKFNIPTRDISSKAATVSCSHCGKQLKRKPCRAHASFFYCSEECMSNCMKVQYRENNALFEGNKKWRMTEEAKLIMKRNGVRSIIAQSDRHETAIEKKIRLFLEESNIPFRQEHPLQFYVVDFLLGNNVVIECFGDYWHYNPNTQSKPPSKKIKINMRRDKAKTSYLKNHGYTLLVLWEHDIHHNFDECKQKILELIK